MIILLDPINSQIYVVFLHYNNNNQLSVTVTIDSILAMLLASSRNSRLEVT